MQCKNCGEYAADGVTICPRCGQPLAAGDTVPGVTAAPVYNQPDYSQPGYSQPGYSQPAAQPAGGAPAPQPAQPAPLYGGAQPQPQQPAPPYGGMPPQQPGFAPPPPMYPPAYPPPVLPAHANQQTSVAPLVLGIVGILGGFWIPLVGIVCGIVGTSLGVRDKRYLKSMATAGLILSIIAICVGGLMWGYNCLFLLY